MSLREENLQKVKRISEMQLGISIFDRIFLNPDFGLLVVEFNTETGTFEKVSESITRLLGYKASDMKGKRVEDFLHPDDVESTYSVIENQLMEGAESKGFVNRYRGADGEYRIMEWYSGGVATSRHIGVALVRSFTDKCYVCKDPILSKIREDIDPSLRRIKD